MRNRIAIYIDMLIDLNTDKPISKNELIKELIHNVYTEINLEKLLYKNSERTVKYRDENIKFEILSQEE